MGIMHHLHHSLLYHRRHQATLHYRIVTLVKTVIVITTLTSNVTQATLYQGKWLMQIMCIRVEVNATMI